jgi:hypothetical protein
MINKLIVPLIYSILFAITESIFTKLKYGYFHTTVEQFFVSLVFSPFLIQINRTYNDNSLLYILLYPFLFWLFEIVTGFTLIYYFNKNNAWTYISDDALFCGMIRLYYYPHFLLLGIIFNYIDEKIIIYLYNINNG